MDKDNYIAKIKIENDEEKKTIEYQENKANVRINKVKGYEEFMDWYNNKWDGSVIKAKEIKIICNVNTNQWETLKENKVIKNKFDSMKQVKRGYYIRQDIILDKI